MMISPLDTHDASFIQPDEEDQRGYYYKNIPNQKDRVRKVVYL